MGKSRQNNIEEFFAKKRVKYIMLISIVVVLYFLSAFIAEYDFIKGIESFSEAFVWIADNMLPDAKAIERFPKILSRLIETTLLSVAVTVVAAILAFIFSIFCSKTTGFHGIVNRIVRIIAAFFRNVPDVVWAMLLMFSFGQNILTGFFALFFSTFGLLTRSFIEVIDEVSSSCVEALKSSGGNFAHIVLQGIVPSTVTEIVVWVMYMIETNIRSSTLVGMLTATGIGYLFDMYYKRLEFGSAGLIIIMIVVTVIIIENISNSIRKAIQ